MKVQEVTRESAKGRNRASANYSMKGNIHERDDEKERMNAVMKRKEGSLVRSLVARLRDPAIPVQVQMVCLTEAA